MTSSVFVLMLLLCGSVMSRDVNLARSTRPLGASFSEVDNQTTFGDPVNQTISIDYANQTTPLDYVNQTDFTDYANQTTPIEYVNQTDFTDDHANQTTPTTDYANQIIEEGMDPYERVPVDICGPGHRSTTQLHRPSGSIKSPNYPAYYPNNVRCDVIISVTPGNVVEITFESFDLEAASIDDECIYDYVGVWDVYGAKLMGKYCGSDIPAPVTVYSDRVVLGFRADSSRSERGFLATFRESSGIGCDNGSFKCAQQSKSPCIDNRRVCDGIADCWDASDEYAGCATKQTCAAMGDRMHCRDGSKCFPADKFCNSVPDCEDGSDEYFGCERRCSGSNETLCSDGKQCIGSDQFCDGWSHHCLDLSDEYPGCGSDCGSDRWACSSGRQCIGSDSFCDGRADCWDESDEYEGCDISDDGNDDNDDGDDDDKNDEDDATEDTPAVNNLVEAISLTNKVQRLLDVLLKQSRLGDN